MAFSKQWYWSELPCPAPGDLPDPEIGPVSAVAPTSRADSLLLRHWGSPMAQNRHFWSVHMTARVWVLPVGSFPLLMVQGPRLLLCCSSSSQPPMISTCVKNQFCCWSYDLHGHSVRVYSMNERASASFNNCGERSYGRLLSLNRFFSPFISSFIFLSILEVETVGLLYSGFCIQSFSIQSFSQLQIETIWGKKKFQKGS